MLQQKNSTLILTILVSALGYFVDVYDIILFAVLRVPSLKALGLSEEDITTVGLNLMNVQLLGMLIGGIVWGMLGDRRGRLSILFGSIILYSTANLANAFVDNVSQYAVLRFIAGFGLAGELGAGITLVSELMSVHRRGMGTTIVTAAGVLGGICGGLVGNLFTWQTAYIIGGCAGFVLLLLRLGLVESGLFISLKTNDNVPKGSLSQFYKKPALFKKYLRCLFIGMPFWIFVGLFMTLAPELGNRLGVTSQVTTSWALLYFNVGLGLGELSSGLLSQWLGSRKKVVSLYIIFSFSVMMAFLNLQDISASYFYGFCALMGLSIGYWAVFLVMSAEQFGTNLRATVTVSLPNFVRGMAVPMTLLLTMLKLHLGIITSLGIIGTTSLFLALLCVFSLPETFARDLDFVET